MTHEPLLPCDYFDAGLCRSCTHIKTPQDIQLKRKFERAKELIPAAQWLEPFESPRSAFRNKVKLVVTGTVRDPKLGILGPDGDGVDLRDCPLPYAGIRTAIPEIAKFITDCDLAPYNMHTDRGVLKYVIISEAPSGELMVRFVVRRRGVQGILFKRYEDLLEAAPNIRVISMNVQPERKAIIEGDEEILITDQATLPIELHVGEDFEDRSLTLQLRPQSFFQTNTDAAEQLYRQAISWVGDADSVWDLYCGVGGFALALATYGDVQSVTGVETSEQAVEAAQTAADQLDGAGSVTFIADDARNWVRGKTPPTAVVVNPPRRGIGLELSSWLDESGVDRVLYSSCNVDTLARDIATMPSFEVAKAQVVDMFPHTTHFETLVLLQRRTSSGR